MVLGIFYHNLVNNPTQIITSMIISKPKLFQVQVKVFLANAMMNLKLVKKYWSKLSLDIKRKRFLRLLIWGKLS